LKYQHRVTDHSTASYHQRSAEQLAGIAGQFLLTVNDTPETRPIFDGFDQERVDVTYTAAEGAAKHASELIVSRLSTRGQTTLLFD
jgi:DNA adenine methylase